ncbi:FecR protein [Symmachiella macrocystis]|uniref:FecR protein n=1 Tax=Symmachiella macrocystis TaxID=2527985 RepID=A0A5C6BK63_9PLAN|nr:FecR domain-containing protein [Symmachiella macrocystis]TWU12112.1 FecR protein [Symmachiella macrocystis]
MSAQEQFAELWTDYLEGELDETGIATLRALLSSDESLLKLAADMYQTHRLLGLVVEEVPSRQDGFVREVLSRLPETSDGFISGVMAGVEKVADTHRATQNTGAGGRHPTAGQSGSRNRFLFRKIVAVVALTTLAIAWYSFRPSRHTDVVKDVPNSNDEAVLKGNVQVASLAHARFFGELSPSVDSVLVPERDYVLMSGLVRVAFPTGASAIVEGPAVFRVMSDECLALDVGHCSVHAPDGAEGFRVETPVTRVIDRGTRFTVNVAETSETEVQVIEGEADIFERFHDDAESEIRLNDGDAQRFAKGREFSADHIPFEPNAYRYSLPDRIVSYSTTTADDGRAENLTSVTVQRDGRVVDIPITDVIPARVTAFKATSSGAFICGGPTIPAKRIETSSDHSLVTGVINPGGSVEPLASTPVLMGESATPGLAIRFDKPVENGPGADVVVFDLQTFSNPPNGDAFHVSPLRFRDGLRSHTIRVYDLTMESPGAHDLTGFHVHMFAEAAESLEQLESLECSPRKQVITFRGLAVGIDLSALGYDDGDTVDGLFFQDALDDQHHFDPVFIGGLPAMK